MNLDDASGGDIQPQQYWFERELTQVSVTHSQLYRTLPNALGRFLFVITGITAMGPYTMSLWVMPMLKPPSS